MNRKILFFGYRLLLTLGFPFLLVFVLFRGFRNQNYFTHSGERFGFLPFRSTIPGGIWLHAVSVGEVILAIGLIRQLKKKLPGLPVYVSCATLAGRAMAEQRLKKETSLIFYAPFDYPWMIRNVLRKLRPSTLIILETEIWPNLWREAKRFGMTLFVVNGRISDRAYPRYQSWRWAFQSVLKLPDRIMVQSQRDAERYQSLGAVDPLNIGNLKYDFSPPGPVPPEIASWAGGRRIFIAASTMPPDEVDTVIAAYRMMPEGTRMILAPRKPELFEEAASKLQEAGIDFVLRTEMSHDAPVLLLNTIGELASTFALDSVVFMGGSIVTWGGHNVLEPAFFGRSILTGPHMQNFAEIDAEFRAADAFRYVHNAEELGESATVLLKNPGEMGQRARALAESKRGSTQKALEVIRTGAPLTHRPFRFVFQMLSHVWSLGVALDRKFTRPRKLSRPVISVGGLAMGGVGKTPFILWLSGKLAAQGIRVGILTRGYHRKEKIPVAYAPGEQPPVELTGDEAQLYLQAGTAWVGIGADRYLTSKLIEKDVDVFLLDDGFQHWRLQRDLDIVLIDPLDPYAGGGVFPAGFLRESFQALERADIVVRPVKRAIHSPPPGIYSAFCGIGNPASFRFTLEQCGIELTEFRVFPDHHHYLPGDLAGMGAPILTTSKDSVKLPIGAPPIRVVQMEIQIPNEEEILERVGKIIELS